MASAAEQMASNMNWGAFGKAKDLQQRIFFALGLLIVYRIGTYIPVSYTHMTLPTIYSV